MNGHAALRNRQLVVFLAIAAFVLALIVWWIVYNVRQERTDRNLSVERLENSVVVATTLLNGQSEPTDPESILTRLFPGLVYLPADGVRGVRDTGKKPILAGEILPDVGLIGERDDRRRGIVRMFMFEGLVFLLVQIVGFAIIYGAFRREVRLKREQENFISAVTHELKSPLTSLGLFIQTLQNHELPEAKREEILGKMLADTRRLDTLVSNLLDAGRALTERFRPDPERLDLGRSVARIVEGLQGYLVESGARLQCAPDESLVVQADPRYLETIFRNLVQNAVKYRSGEPVIQVRTERNGKSGVLIVADNGLGLGRGEVKRIFRKFYRVGDEMVRRAPGSGLGLYLSREMARSMGGDITADSPGPGRGTTFRVFLPLAEA